MPDYEFYRARFGGTDLTPDEFRRYAALAARHLQKARRCWRMQPVEENAAELALCQLAETLSYFDWLENGGAASGVAVGSVSQKGASLPKVTAQSKARELYRAMGLYFDIYRGGAGGGSCCEE